MSIPEDQPSAPPTQLYLIRHGDATYSPDDGAPALTPLGVLQAQRLRDRLAATSEIAADILIASTMRRAVVTAEIIAPSLELPIQLDPDMEEIRTGAAAGLTPEERHRRWGKPVWLDDPSAGWAPLAESPAAFTHRVCRALTRLMAEHAGRTIVVVCHGGVIRAACLYFQGLDDVACVWPGAGMIPLPRHVPLVSRPWVASLGPANTSITHWRLEVGSLTRRPTWMLETFNDALHLRDIAAPERLNWSALARPRTTPQALPALAGTASTP